MERDANPCTWLSPSALQSELRPVSVTPGKSLHPALTAGLPTSLTLSSVHAHMYCTGTYAQSYLTDSTSQQVFSLTHTCAWFLRMYMHSLSIILILMALEVEMQPHTIYRWLWFPRRISMDTTGGIWNKSQHIIARRLPDLLVFLSLSHDIVVAVYEWFCIIHASHSRAVTVDLQMTQMQSFNRSRSGGKWDVKGNASDL